MKVEIQIRFAKGRMETVMIPRCEHPRPDLYRDGWLSLNGIWEFDFWNKKSFDGYDPNMTLTKEITVPFCPESTLSGIADTGEHLGAIYKRSFTLTQKFNRKRTFLHIGACDYFTRVYINGNFAGEHKGGYTPISLDITDLIVSGENFVSIITLDDTKDPSQPSGKQTMTGKSHGCFYTTTTGIWQTVWLEARDASHTVKYNAIPHIDEKSVTLELDFSAAAIGNCAEVIASYEGKEMGKASFEITAEKDSVTLPLAKLHLWEAGCGRLYDLKISVGDNDTLNGYFGMREAKIENGKFTLNGKEIFLRFVLDQGFYPDGIYTAPSDDALRGDIELSMRLGFNGARLHQKVFEPRFLYHADKLGYMVFGEFPNWGLDHTDINNKDTFLAEWREAVERDISHPAIIGWCPFNETWDKDGRRQSDEMIDAAYYLTKSIDKTRIVITNSGSEQSLADPLATDAYDIHDYEQSPDKFSGYYEGAKGGIIKCQLWRKSPERQIYNGLPIFLSEYGGIKWTDDQASRSAIQASNPDRTAAWGYGEEVRSEEEFFTRLGGLTKVIVENGSFIGFCYTQLTDVEQEQNGVVKYDRSSKFPAEKFAEVFTYKAN